MRNQYVECYICKEEIYLYRKNAKLLSAQMFFDKRRSVKRNNLYFCKQCYNDIYIYKCIKLIKKNKTIFEKLYDFN
ncbi:hypothetical protein ManeNPV_00036 [Malacosoma neustria nucleopolyhedrovirus]|uniref:hypothetical protein n=1 Tax=Malacosoma neustria nuclear polyhedrosis virus TaxID=38012 RepID=UPI000E35EF2F|nr:hypothetical protein ManeNPV_00036 [Malacosoma neustria nucleopolyhedrovirus]AUF81564.1 hypothetical protein ManeNPV_00036 [Malacosoma neustria nucleopolyhedrovirus]